MKFHEIKVGLVIALVAVSAGCVGYVDDGGYGGPDVVVEGPGLWSGPFHYGGHDVHAFSHRGSVSRGIAHGGGGRRR